MHKMMDIDSSYLRECVEEIYLELKDREKIGKVADYIPELSKVSRDKFGISIITHKGDQINFGDYDEKFSIQSISKLFSLILVLERIGDRTFQRVGKEPSGNPFNSLIQLEHENGKPRNPFINGGALVITDILTQLERQPLSVLIDFLRETSGNSSISFNYQVMESEKMNSDRNSALAYFIKSFGNIESDVTTLLTNYFTQCSIEMSCLDLSKVLYLLANHGTPYNSTEQHLSKSLCKRINTLMLISGMYNSSGEYAYKTGIPSKSGVGGGIVGIVPNFASIAVWSPPLDRFGNSYLGVEFMDMFSTKTGISIF